MMDGNDANKTQPGTEERRQEVAVGDALHSSLRTGLFDYAISIATIHHFSTWERRRASVQELIRIVAPVERPSRVESERGSAKATDPRLEGGFGRGRFMIFVWALEQKDEGKRQFEAEDPRLLKSKREIDDPNRVKSKDRLVSYSGLQTTTAAAMGGTAEMGREKQVTDDQDVLVPWVLTESKKKVKPPRPPKGKKSLPQPSSATTQIESGLSTLKIDPSTQKEKPQEDASRPIYNRYYHMFRVGELEALVADAVASMPPVHRGGLEGVEVVHESGGWERGNWWGVWRVQWSS